MMTDAVRRWLGVYAVLLCVFTVLPVAAIVLESFTSSDYLVFPPNGLSVRWYRAILDRPEFLQSAWVSVVVALGASILATLLGTLAALAMARHRFPGRRALQSLFMAPMSLPGLILGLALLQFITARGLPRDLSTLMIAHVIVTIPFAIRFVTVSLSGMDPNVETAAQSLGANPLRAFLTVTLPLIQAGVAASLVFTFILSFDDVAVSLFLANANTTTLPVRIYTYIDQNYDPLVTSVSALIVLTAFLALAVLERIIGVGRLFGLR